MNSNCKFSTYNPIINFTFFIIAIVFGMIFMQIPYQIVSLVAAILFYISIAGRDAIKLILILIPLYGIVVLINELISGGGFVLANMFATMIIWFASYSRIMTTDKFVYIFGPIMPSISLIFTMVLRFIPSYKKKATQIANARKCIGKNDPFSVVSAMTTWAFEDGLITADSMKSRGFGSRKRTHYSIYKFGPVDIAFLLIMIGLSVIVSFASIKGNTYQIVGLIAYGILLIIPTILNVKEVLLWQILRSRI